jgi:3'-phosphoadenosine 5'-phosphosulfate sulfotransferase (PAPS reductase)/FAD synthetase
MSNKHEPHDLAQMQSLPLEAKIIMTQQRIRDWYDYWNGDVYVSFSGGKDSTVLKHIVDNMWGVYDVPAVFVNTGLEYPEIQKFVKDIKAGKFDCFNSNVEIIRPKMRFDEVLKKYGYPVVSKEISEYSPVPVTVAQLSFSVHLQGIDRFSLSSVKTQFLLSLSSNEILLR